MTTPRQHLFIKTLTSLFQAQQSVADLFFKNRLTEEIEKLIDKHLAAAGPEYIRELKNTEKLLEEISYLGQGEPVKLAQAQEQVLHYLYNVLKDKSPRAESPEVVASPVSEPEQKSRIGQKQLNDTQNKILEFVRRVPERRAKEIIVEFSAMSNRTIKRGLKELSQEGLIMKKSGNGTVYYSAV
jgi:hypothetical protein